MGVVIVGGGLAGASAAAELRERGYDGEVTLFAGESHLPYERPPLSKEILLGVKEPDSAVLHDREWYDDRRITVHAGEPVLAVDRDAAEVRSDHRAVAYDQLLLATGSQARSLPEAQGVSAPVSTLRTLEDSVSIRADFGPGRRLAVIGGGWIGLEVAAAARAAGTEVVVVEPLGLPLLRVLGPAVAVHFAELHRRHGVEFRLLTRVTAVEAAADGRGVVHLDKGAPVTADRIVVGIGADPDDSLARAAGLDVADTDAGGGVLVDDRLRTSDPNIFAAGDIANAEHPVLGRRVRVEHWDTALGQGRHAAAVMLGEDRPYERLPYFFTDQYDLGMEYVGSVPPSQTSSAIVRGAPESGAFTAFWVDGDRVLAGMQVNDWGATEPIRALLGKRMNLSRLADEAVELGSLV